MKHILFFLFLFLLYVCPIVAQDYDYEPGYNTQVAPNRFYIGLRGNLIFPVVSLADIYTSGIGAGLQVKYVLEDKIGLGAHFDYNILGPKGGAIPGQTHTLMSYGGYLEYIFPQKNKGFRPYLSCGLSNYVHDINTNINAGGISISQTIEIGNSLGITPAIGVMYRINSYLSAYTVFTYYHVFELPVVINATTQMIGVSGGFLFLIGK